MNKEQIIEVLDIVMDEESGETIRCYLKRILTYSFHSYKLEEIDVIKTDIARELIYRNILGGKLDSDLNIVRYNENYFCYLMNGCIHYSMGGKQ